jgi:AraC-like DNA-binding protein
MMRAQPNANPQMLRYLEQQIAGIARSWPQDFTQQVEQLVTANIAGGGADVDHVASLLALSRRTFQRRLAEHGLRFPEVLRQVRLRIADDYYATERRPNLAELAHRLGLADAGVASRFLRMHHLGARALKGRRRE